MVAFQNHVRPTVKDLENVGLIVLAAQAEDESLARQVDHQPLELPNTPAASAIPSTPSSPTTPFPDCVVAVQDDDLIGRVEDGVDLASHDRAQAR